ncbi:hypothetical protein CTAYLR_005405 [Chrysophaeum taylorii]|uniref:Protein kinase domain-containing protein n=1 Tax=Chrysophaeum taylorii TaxID=2483200 RepID=A0AAD7U7Q1_9STRA|nr:hypothetical protein CTAYLR_005405 [Chrysophaeum taylorii]
MSAVEFESLEKFEQLRRKAEVERGGLKEAQGLINAALSSDGESAKRLDSLVERRNKARAAYVRALNALQNGYSSSDLSRERVALEREVQFLEASLISLGEIQTDFQAAARVAQPELPSLEPGSTSAAQAVRAFELWERETDPRTVTDVTDDTLADAWCKLRDVAETQGANEACDAWEVAHREALEAADREQEYWSSRPHPLSLLPVDTIRTAVTSRLDACKSMREDQLNRARDRVREARRTVDEIHAAEIIAERGDKPWREAKERLKIAKKTLRNSQHQLEDAGDEDEETSGDVESLRERVRVARRELHRAQRATEDEVSKLAALVKDYYPELAIVLKAPLKTVVTLSPALQSVVRQGRNPQDYERIPWPEHSEPPTSRHITMAYLYDGQACVLKQFHLRNSSERRALEREVETLVALSHPNVAKLECVFFVENQEVGDAQAFIQSPLYRGGTLRQWLARPENAIAERMMESAVSQWGTLRFFKPEHRHVATAHVRGLRQLLGALSYIHAKGVIHGDVKLDNVLVDVVDKTWTVVLSDFDMSRTELDGGSTAMTTRAGGGTPGYVAPECHRAGCGCGFCAYCLADCGADAHQHVRNCAHGQGLFPARARETFERAQRARRDRDLRAFLLQTLADDEARAVLISGLERELRDLGLDPQVYLQVETRRK